MFGPKSRSRPSPAKRGALTTPPSYSLLSLHLSSATDRLSSRISSRLHSLSCTSSVALFSPAPPSFQRPIPCSSPTQPSRPSVVAAAAAHIFGHLESKRRVKSVLGYGSHDISVNSTLVKVENSWWGEDFSFASNCSTRALTHQGPLVPNILLVQNHETNTEGTNLHTFTERVDSAIQPWISSSCEHI